MFQKCSSRLIGSNIDKIAFTDTKNTKIQNIATKIKL